MGELIMNYECEIRNSPKIIISISACFSSAYACLRHIVLILLGSFSTFIAAYALKSHRSHIPRLRHTSALLRHLRKYAEDTLYVSNTSPQAYSYHITALSRRPRFAPSSAGSIFAKARHGGYDATGESVDYTYRRVIHMIFTIDYHGQVSRIAGILRLRGLCSLRPPAWSPFT